MNVWWCRVLGGPIYASWVGYLEIVRVVSKEVRFRLEEVILIVGVSWLDAHSRLMRAMSVDGLEEVVGMLRAWWHGIATTQVVVSNQLGW